MQDVVCGEVPAAPAGRETGEDGVVTGGAVLAGVIWSKALYWASFKRMDHEEQRLTQDKVSRSNQAKSCNGCLGGWHRCMSALGR